MATKTKKGRVCISINPDLLDKIDVICKANGTKLSKLTEELYIFLLMINDTKEEK